LESIEWRSISTQSIPPRLISEFLSPQIAHLSRLILPKLSTLADCCLGWMAQHLQAFCMLLATHRHHIVAVPSSLSNCRCPMAIFESPSSSPLLYYIDESIVVVTMAVCADEVLLFPQPTEHIAHHRCCRQPQQPQSIIGRSSLPSQHKAGCYVERGQIVGDSLTGLSSLSLRHSRRAVASCMPPSPLCQIPQPAPPPFVTLLCPTCSVGCRVARWPPSVSQPAPPPLFTPLHLLVVASRRVASHCLAPWPSLLLSSRLRLSLRPFCLVGCRVVLPGALASLPLLLPCSKCRCRRHQHRCCR
jgi:hypothetical protein